MCMALDLEWNLPIFFPSLLYRYIFLYGFFIHKLFEFLAMRGGRQRKSQDGVLLWQQATDEFQSKVREKTKMKTNKKQNRNHTSSILLWKKKNNDCTL